MANRIRVTDEGAVATPIPDGQSALPPSLQDAPGVAAAGLSAAQRRRKMARERSGELEPGQKRFEPLELEGETVYVRKLQWAEALRCKLEYSRNSGGWLDIEAGSDEARSYGVAVAQTCIYEAPDEAKPYYAGLADAAEDADSLDDTVASNFGLMVDAATALNQTLIPRILRAREIPSPHVAPQDPENPPSTDEKPATTNSTSTSGETSGTPTPSTDGAPTSPSGKEDGPSTSEATPGT